MLNLGTRTAKPVTYSIFQCCGAGAGGAEIILGWWSRSRNYFLYNFTVQLSV